MRHGNEHGRQYRSLGLAPSLTHPASAKWLLRPRHKLLCLSAVTHEKRRVHALLSEAALRLLDEPLLFLLVVLARTPVRLTLAPATAENPMDEWWLHRLCQTCQRFVTVR